MNIIMLHFGRIISTIPVIMTENVDEESASTLFLYKQGRISIDGMPTYEKEEHNFEDVSYYAGIESNAAAGFYGMKKDPEGLSKGKRLRSKTEALIRQNPPRGIRFSSNLIKP